MYWEEIDHCEIKFFSHNISQKWINISLYTKESTNILKKGDPQLFTNYRPMNILASFSRKKIFPNILSGIILIFSLQRYSAIWLKKNFF